MGYNLFCRGFFNSINNNNPNEYQLDIFKKDYDGDYINIIFGANPVIHQWQDDDPQKPIKGSSISINIINEGNISLSDFYSNEDDTFLIVLYKIDFAEELLFKGFIIQDDCSEIMVDYAHEIQLSATDNLGILKDYTFDQAAIKFGPYATNFGLDIQTVTDGVINYIKVNETFIEEYTKIRAGNKIEITGGTYFDGIYTVLNVFANGTSGFSIQVEESVGGNSPSTLCNLTYQIPYDISSYLSVKEILRLCILSTGIELEELRVLSRLKPDGKDRWIDDTFIDCRSYINNNIYYDCYKILEDLMTRFRSSLFQAYGFWYIVRIGEYSLCNDYTTTTQYVNRYDALDNFNFLVSGLEERFLNIDTNMAENGVIKSLLRPYNYVRENFNYNANQNLLTNGDLQQLGNLITSYTSGSNTVYEYEAPGFDYYQSNNTQIKYYIRIVFDANNNESERYLVLQTIDSDIIAFNDAIISKGIYLSKGDIVTIKYNTRLSRSWFGENKSQINRPFVFDPAISYALYIGYSNYPYLTTSELEVNGCWTTGGNVINYYLTTEDTAQWRSINIISQPAPFSGIFYLPLSFFGNQDMDNTQTHFNNLSVNISSVVNTQTNIIGHFHKTICNTNIKNYDEIDIKLDDSKSNSISGTLFLDTDTNDIRDRTLKWNYEGTCERVFNNVEFYYGYEHPIAGDNVIFIPGANLPSDFNVNDYPYGSEFTITNSTNGSNGTYTVNFIEAITFVPPYINYYVWTVESQPSVSALGTGDFEFNGIFQAKPLGQLITFEQMYLRWRTRSKLDINIYSIMGNSSQFFGPLHILKYYGLQDIIFFLGSISLNYRTNSAQCTLYGLIDENEKRSDLEAVSSYEFNYLYENS